MTLLDIICPSRVRSPLEAAEIQVVQSSRAWVMVVLQCKLWAFLNFVLKLLKRRRFVVRTAVEIFNYEWAF